MNIECRMGRRVQGVHHYVTLQNPIEMVESNLYRIAGMIMGESADSEASFHRCVVIMVNVW